MLQLATSTATELKLATIYFFLEVQVYMIKCNHYKPSLCVYIYVHVYTWWGMPLRRDIINLLLRMRFKNISLVPTQNNLIFELLN